MKFVLSGLKMGDGQSATMKGTSIHGTREGVEVPITPRCGATASSMEGRAQGEDLHFGVEVPSKAEVINVDDNIRIWFEVWAEPVKGERSKSRLTAALIALFATGCASTPPRQKWRRPAGRRAGRRGGPDEVHSRSGARREAARPAARRAETAGPAAEKSQSLAPASVKGERPVHRIEMIFESGGAFSVRCSWS